MFDREPLPLPPGLDEAPCGPVLDALVGTVDLEATSGYDRVELLRALQRQVSHLQARLYQAAPDEQFSGAKR